MAKIVLTSLILLLLFTLNSKAKTLEDVVKEIGIVPLQVLSEDIKNLPQEEKIKLQVLIMSYLKEKDKEKELIQKLLKGKVMTNILELPQNLYALIVDKTNEVLYVVKKENGVPVVLKEFPCITGKREGDKLKEGDLRTPEGIYFPLYWKTGLPKIYGIGAFPLNYPNLLDREILKRDGHGIWIHGTDNPNRPPHSTNGCIVLKNEYLKELKKFISLRRTPVVIVSKLSLASKSDYINEKESLLNFILKWKKAWEETPKDLTPYFSCYSENFKWKGGDINSWKRYKSRITKFKKWIKIKISDITAVKDGRVLNFGNLYVVRLKLNYSSNNYNSVSNKILYIINEGGRWKILGEENL